MAARCSTATWRFAALVDDIDAVEQSKPTGRRSTSNTVVDTTLNIGDDTITAGNGNDVIVGDDLQRADAEHPDEHRACRTSPTQRSTRSTP